MKIQLKRRLTKFAILIIDISSKLARIPIGKYLGDQISRASISSALNYGEALSAESDKDFIHKLSLVSKELRETSIGLEILLESDIYKYKDQIKKALEENDELLAIFYKTIDTLKKKHQSQLNEKRKTKNEK